MLYFAYGSNMSTRRLKARTPGVRFHATAILKSHALLFHKIGQDGSGKCDILACNDDRCVHGVLYELSDEEKVLLDRYEGLGKGYQHRWVQVTTGQGRCEFALTYVATHIDPSVKPFHWYKQHVCHGAHEHKLPAEYIRQLQLIESTDDPDLDRQARELRLYD